MPSIEDRLTALEAPSLPVGQRMRQRRALLFVRTTADLPGALDNPMLYYVEGPPVQLFLVDKDGQKELGYTALAAATEDLDPLTTANQDVVGASLTLPHVGVYVVDAVFDFFFDSVSDFAGATIAVGVLTNSSDVEETGIAAFAVSSDVAIEDPRATVSQVWIITTTSRDEVFKLRARKSRTVAGEIVKVLTVHTRIRASSFLGGGQTATSHQHSHDTDLTGVSANDHHNQSHADGDHTAGFGAPTGDVDIGDAAAEGVATTHGRSDHQHAHPAPGAGYPVDIAAAEADGAATTPARSDHGHAHGSGYLANAHHTEDHATRHEPGGGDAMAVDAVAGTGSLRTLGAGAQQAAVGTHAHPAKISKTWLFHYHDETLVVNADFNGENPIRIPSSGQHGTFALNKLRVTCKVAGSGINTIKLQSSLTLTGARTDRAEVALDAAREASDTTISYVPGVDEYLWVRATAVDPTAPKGVVAQLDGEETLF